MSYSAAMTGATASSTTRITSFNPEFLANIRDATNGGFALLSERFRASLAPNIQRRVERKPPGPAPKSKAGAATVCEKEPQFELGLRPRTSP